MDSQFNQTAAFYYWNCTQDFSGLGTDVTPSDHCWFPVWV